MTPIIAASLLNPLVDTTVSGLLSGTILFAQSKGSGMAQTITGGADLETAEAFGRVHRQLCKPPPPDKGETF